MFFFGKRWVFAVCLLLYTVVLGAGIPFVNHQYDAIKTVDGPHAALAMSAIGVGVLFLVQILMTLALFVRIHTTHRTMWWILPSLVPFAGIPFLLIGVLGETEHPWNPGYSEPGIGGTELKPLVGIVGMLFITALATLFMGVKFYGEINPNNPPNTTSNGVWINESASSRLQPQGTGIPLPVQRNSCYDRDRVNTIGQSGWIGGCAGMLIVDNMLLREAASNTVGGNERFALLGPDGRYYTFANGTRTVFTGQVTDLSSLFYNTTFNGDIGHWNTSNVSNMSYTFAFDKSFNQNIAGWDTSNVFDMSGMFEAAETFNNKSDVWGLISWFTSTEGKSIGGWNTPNVISMRRMFAGATVFNQPIKTWDVSSVTDISEMFSKSYAFNQDLETWNTSNMQNMFGTFESATLFNGNITTWDVSRANNLSYMFYGAANFNQDISAWNTANVLYMSYIFGMAESFNSPVGGWSTSNVIGMDGVFAGAGSFNQPIEDWDLSQTIDTSAMFSDAIAFNQPIGGWNTSEVLNMSRMFFNAESFNQDVGSWNTSNVIAMDSMFENARAFDQNLSRWAISLTEQPTRFSTGTPQEFRDDSFKHPFLLGQDGPGTGVRFDLSAD